MGNDQENLRRGGKACLQLYDGVVIGHGRLNLVQTPSIGNTYMYSKECDFYISKQYSMV